MIIGTRIDRRQTPRLARFVDCFDELLSVVATPALTPFLSYEQRLDLTCDLLLGHPPVRGGHRPRDFPLGPVRQLSLEIARLLATTDGPLSHGISVRMSEMFTAKSPGSLAAAPMPIRTLGPRLTAALQGTFRDKPVCRLYDFVAATRVLVAIRDHSNRGARAQDEPNTLRILGGLLFSVLGDLAKHDQKRGNVSVTSAREATGNAYKFCMDALSFTGWEMMQVRSGVQARELIALARWMAFLASRSSLAAESTASGQDYRAALFDQKRTRIAERLVVLIRSESGIDGEETKKLGGALRASFDALDRARFQVLSLKAKNVQRFLGRTKRSFVQRGASAWCSQTVARLRDHFSSGAWGGPSLPILVDSDAIVMLAAPATLNISELGAAAERFLSEFSGAGVGVHEAYPRLSAALLAAAQQGLSPRSLHPDVEIQLVQMSALEYALHCTPQSGARARVPAQRYLVRSASATDTGNEAVAASGVTCHAVWGQQGFTAPTSSLEPDLRLPTWLSQNRKGAEQYGLAGWGYALAGSGWRMVTGRGILRALERARRSGQCRLPDDWSMLSLPFRKPRLEAWESSTDMIVRMDGNDVGDMFLGAPRLRGPSLSPCLELNLGQRWLAALCRLLESRANDLPHVLPVQLLYFGGDDLQFQIAASCWELFWDAMVAHSDAAFPPEVRRIAFKVAAVEVPNVHDDEPGGYLFANACMPTLIQLAKRRPTGTMRGMLRRQGIIGEAMKAVPGSKALQRQLEREYRDPEVTRGRELQLALLRRRC